MAANPIVPLTDTQREYAEKNHNLLYTFLQRRNLVMDEWYDVAAIGFVKAVKSFRHEQNSNFSSYAFLCMDCEVAMEMRRNKAVSRSATIVYLEDAISGDQDGNQLTLADVLYADDSSFEAIATQDVMTAYITRAKALDRNVIKLLLSGKTQVEIGIVLGHSQSYISRVIKNIQGRMKSLLFDEGAEVNHGHTANRRSSRRVASGLPPLLQRV